MYTHKRSITCVQSLKNYHIMKTFVAYYRVSTEKQGRSGLGLEAQRKAVEEFVGSAGVITEEFVEVESGKKNNRAQLEKALKACRKAGATLVVAKLDRLSRSLSLIARIMESGSEFVAADNPHANKFTIHILGAVAEFERDQISTRTKAALAAAKARGVELGRNGKELAKTNAAAADAFALEVRPHVDDARDAGHTSVRAIAAELNRKGIETAGGGSWHPTTVQRLLERLDSLSKANQLPFEL